MVLGLVLVEIDDSHRGYNSNFQEAGGRNSHRGHVRGVLIKELQKQGGIPSTAYSPAGIQVEDDVDDDENL